MDSDQAKLLLEQLLDDITLTGLLEKCAQLMGSPLRFTFRNGPEGFMVTEGYPYADVIRSQLEIARSTYDSDEGFRLLTERLEKEHGHKAFILVPAVTSLSRRLICVAASGGQRVGLLSLPEYEKPLEECDPDLMALCARCAAFRMLQTMQQNTVTAAQQGMHLLLSPHGASYNDVIGISGSAILPRNGEYRLMILLPSGSRDSQRLAVLAGQIARLLSSEWFAFRKDEAAVLFEEARAVTEIRRQVDRLLEIGDARACLSPVIRDIMDTRLWRQRMVRLPAFNRAAPGTLTVFEDWLDWGLFGEASPDPVRLAAFIPREITAIRDWDSAHGTAYLPTLKAYVGSGGRRKQAAAELDTHINTVNYRLQKIEDLFGLDLNEPDTSFRAFFAFRLMAYLEGLS